MKFSTITIIYNPNSTGSSESRARSFKKKLLKASPGSDVHLKATEYAGHAEELAYTLAQTKHALIMSSSGDGGYNEVINGVMKAKKEGYDTTTGLLPAGNANDHYHNLHSNDSVDAVLQGTSRNVDLLTLNGTSEGKSITRYGHSYIGFGLTPIVGDALNQTKLNKLNEAWIVAKELFTLTSVKLIIGGISHHYHSVVFSNVDTMSKYMKISQPSAIDDGKFEVTLFRRKEKLKLIRQLLTTTIIPAKEDASVSSYSLKTVHKTLVQIDGEIISLDPDTKVKIGIEKQILSCIV